MKYLIVIDIQNDFVSGSLANRDSLPIIKRAEKKIKNFDGEIIFTRDTHGDNYFETQEGQNLPVSHCIKETEGWQIVDELEKLRIELGCKVIDKPTFGSADLAEFLKEKNENDRIESIELFGLDTDICVISNALLIKAFLPEVPIYVDALCSAGTTPENHKNALNAMKVCQIYVKEE